ncbi:TetR/AcrR family transcriptional regulator [Acidovorax sp. Root219]|uniref:TetR/AcrR family transcriptional regulator n=1 Tax=Acidovorax sp. Root219 TaxID=1736493 RepID=UPI00070B652D|nr:TetR family transcriptional regulator [Acidovorax sp. Root219]KRC21140.1 TetR family transcriptional regulator [Acidovorax sp. Root219]
MKTTRQQQDATRRQIVASAVDLMTRQGFDGTTMKDIARAAGIGDATIYKYFPTKDRIVLGYLDEAVRSALADTLATPGLADYGLQEKLQRLTDAVLERLLPDREFVAAVRTLARRSPLSMLAEPLAARQALREAVTGFIETAESHGEIEPCDFKGVASGLYGDYLAGVVAYWLADESDEFADTTQLVDLSLGVLVLALRAGLVNRVLQLGGFMLRSQMARFMQHGSGLVGVLRMAKSALGDTMVPPVDTPPRTPRARPSAQAPVADAPKPARKPRARKAAP